MMEGWRGATRGGVTARVTPVGARLPRIRLHRALRPRDPDAMHPADTSAAAIGTTRMIRSRRGRRPAGRPASAVGARPAFAPGQAHDPDRGAGAGGRRRRRLGCRRSPHPDPPRRSQRPHRRRSGRAGRCRSGTLACSARAPDGPSASEAAPSCTPRRAYSTGRLPPLLPETRSWRSPTSMPPATARVLTVPSDAGSRERRCGRGAPGTAEPPGALRRLRGCRASGRQPVEAWISSTRSTAGTRSSRRRSDLPAPRSIAPSTEAPTGARWR